MVGGRGEEGRAFRSEFKNLRQSTPHRFPPTTNHPYLWDFVCEHLSLSSKYPDAFMLSEVSWSYPHLVRFYANTAQPIAVDPLRRFMRNKRAMKAMGRGSLPVYSMCGLYHWITISMQFYTWHSGLPTCTPPLPHHPGHLSPSASVQ